ncbi:MAG: carbohydrate kinase family protein [Armatimonadota bacterium]|nr:carbohydrate kinase family protein [Armatimonadota bacterium]MDR7403514.1 carbohydrate kinase family protein [Armatimonadota bacterium]MDR7559963.1 carbohydrate kinase family protein [Armatimonadota bacterium]MDR7587681.1 carbohydrate kinase family protein [Armatimonadota bacterium]MDR7611490.1 carbohydrate kinase family protein [Armatimonadota bacterium]
MAFPSPSGTFIAIGGLVADIILPVRRFPILPQDHQIAQEVMVEPGGLGNCLVMTARLGMRAMALGWAGTDAVGEDLCRMLRTEGVNVDGVLRQPGRTALSCVLVDDQGHHVFVGGLGVRGPDTLPSAWRDALTQPAWVMSDGWVLWHSPAPVTDALDTARASGGRVVFDPGPMIHRVPEELVHHILRITDVLLLTEEEAGLLVGPGDAPTLTRALHTLGPSVVALKQGAAGALVLAGDELVRQPAFPARVRDTTGAGDAFDAAFIAGLAVGLSIPQASALAAAAGALAVSRLGTGTALPTRSELEVFLAARGLDIRLPPPPGTPLTGGG